MHAPVTIWRHLSVDLVRLIVLTTVIFVGMLSFAATVKYFAEGKLTLADMLVFMLYACPPMLHYALPFAAGFGATLAYHRLEQDNERIAAHAGGVSHRSLLLPATVIGLTLTVLLTVVNQEIAPRYLRRMESLIVDRVGKVIMARIDQGDPITFQDWMIYADGVTRLEPDGEPGGPDEEFALTGVGAIRLDEGGDVEVEVTAGVAWVYLFKGGAPGEGERNDSSTRVDIRVQDASTWSRAGGRGSAEWTTLRWTVPDRFDDNPKYLTWGELQEAKRNPDMLNVIDAHRQNLAFHEAQRRVVESLRRSLGQTGTASLVDADGRELVLHARDVRWRGPGYEIVPEEGRPVGVDQTLGRERTRTVRTTADEAILFVDIGEDMKHRDLAVSMVLRPARTTELDDAGRPTGEPGVLDERRLTDLTIADEPLDELLAMRSDELMAEVDARVHGEARDEYVTGAYIGLRDRIDELMREISAKQHERVAMAVSCLVMVLSGSIVALRLGRGQPLTAYVWSFFPAVLSIITISVGQQVGHDAGLVGYILLWSGVGGLAAYALIAYVGLVRH